MIRLEKINADNYQKVFDLELVGEQENFVSSNIEIVGTSLGILRKSQALCYL